jgi:hypothetical protein
MIVWSVSYLSGPGFVFGTAGAVSPAGTHLGVVPGIPVLGALPLHSSPWLLVIVLLPIAIGAGAGYLVRVRLLQEWNGQDAPFGPRAIAAIGIALLSAAGMAVLAAVSSGALGPGGLAHVGPIWWAAALAVGVEVLLGAAILLLGSRSPRERGMTPA